MVVENIYYAMGIPLSIGIGGSESKTHVTDENKLPTPYRIPSNLKTLSDSTRFSKDELQAVYRSFKQECPSGVINEEAIKDIYSRFFPQGDASEYARLVFRLLDGDGTGFVTFEGLISNLSILLKGSIRDRLGWVFRLYDKNNDGFVSREELTNVVSSIHKIVGSFKGRCPYEEKKFVDDHVDSIFNRMDLNKDGLIDMDEFTSFCLGEPQVCGGLEAMDVGCNF